jgi:hypothetical protein
MKAYRIRRKRTATKLAGGKRWRSWSAYLKKGAGHDGELRTFAYRCIGLARADTHPLINSRQ